MILEPELAKKSIAVAELMKNLANEQKQADKVRNVVKTDEEAAKVHRCGGIKTISLKYYVTRFKPKKRELWQMMPKKI